MSTSTLRMAAAARQRGLSLIIVLVALLVIGFAAVALLRSSDTTTLASGNLAFQRSALAAGDASAEAAIQWLVDNSASGALFSDDVASGYFSTTAEGCDLTGSRTPDNPLDDVDWTGTDPGNECNLAAEATAPDGVADGYSVRYVINRVCSRAGGGASEGSTRAGSSYGSMPLGGPALTYYRITTRVDGPRDTVRYVQAFVVL